MKLLHVISTISPRYGGPSSVLRPLSVEQARRGHQVTICTTNQDYPDDLLDVPTDRPVVESGVTIWYHELNFRPLAVSMAMVRWLLKHVSRFDIVHVHGLYRFPQTFSAALARRRAVPYIIQPHGALDPFLYRQSRHSLPLKRLYERLFEFPNLNSASAIHYTSDDELKRAQPLGLRAPPVVVPNGLDWSAFADPPGKGAFRGRLGLESNQPLILFLGRLNFKKGLDLLIPAFARLLRSAPDAVLAVVGPDNEGYGKDVRRWCVGRGVRSSVRFVDHVSAAEAREAYIDADVFALPSYTENFGMTVVEAMACGCPVVISDQVNIWPFVKEAGAGVVVPLEVEKISEALSRVLRNPEGSARMGAAGRALAQARFSWGPIVEHLDRVYGALVRGEPPEAPQRANAA